jgi:hypothetical protein
MEILAGARTQANEDVRRGFLGHFRVVPLTGQVAEEAVKLRREYRLKLPDYLGQRDYRELPARVAQHEFSSKPGQRTISLSAMI